MEDRIKELISKGTSAGYNEVQIIDALRSIGANDSQIKEAQDLFKKKAYPILRNQIFNLKSHLLYRSL
jgi:hypothetical protein